MIGMIRQPRLGTDITKCPTTSSRWGTMHIVTTHGSFDELLAEWAYFGVLDNPVNIGFLFDYDFLPGGYIGTTTRSMDFIPASETEDFSTFTLDCIEQWILRIDAELAVCSWAKLDVVIHFYILLT